MEKTQTFVLFDQINQPKSNEIQPNEIQSNEIEPNEIQPNEIQPNEIQPNEIQSNEIQPNEIQPNIINNAKAECIVTISHVPFRKFTSHQYQQPPNRSSKEVPNFLIIQNAIKFTAMPSPQMDLQKNQLIASLRDYSDHRILMLMSNLGNKMKAFYILQEDNHIQKIWGNGPSIIAESDVGKFWKYDTSAKCFEQIKSHHFTQTTDGFCLKREIEPRNW